MPMTKLFLAFFVGFLLFAPLREVSPGPNDPVSIPDATLRAAIEQGLGKTSGDTITEAEMAGFTGEISVRSVSSLTGLEYATSVRKMEFTNSAITDLSPLADLTQLETLVLFHAGGLTDISPLKKLTALTTLSIRKLNPSDTPSFSDISVLADLTQLKILYLNYNEIVNLSPLQKLTLLTELYLTGNKIVDISSLMDLTALVLLHLNENKITDISPLRGLTDLETLYLDQNMELSDISPLTRLEKLEALWLDQTAITVAGLSGVLSALPTLKQLNIKTTRISDLSVFDRLHTSATLASLDLRSIGSPGRDAAWLLTDITPLVGFVQAGRMGADSRFPGSPKIQLEWNLGLDYESIYTDLPALINGLSGGRVSYHPSEPTLAAENQAGHPGTDYTFVVRAGNNTTIGSRTYENSGFEKAPVTFTVTNPDGTTETHGPVLTDEDGLAGVTITLGSDGDTYTVEAVVPANAPIPGEIEHPELRVTFTVRADRTVPPPLNSQPDRPDRLTVTFEDYPEEKPIDEFTLTIRFSEPVIGFEKADITVDTELTRGKGTATLTALTPETPVRPDRPDPDPVEKYFATVELPDGARGTVTLSVRAETATGSILRVEGPASDTTSDPIEFGRRVIICPPSVVPMDTVIFNEFRNAADDKNDWVELKNISDEPVSLTEWEVSLVLPHAISPVAPQWEIFAMDRDVVAFPDYTLPPGGILLIVNTHPSETDLIRGQNIGNPNRNPDLSPHYLIAPEMKLPNSEFLLILRSVRDKNGQWEGFEDLAGDYHKDDVNYATNIWPLRCTPVYTGTAAPRFSEGDVYQRVMVPKFSSRTLVATLQPEKRGYLKGAWMLSDYHGGLGYRPKVSPEESLGTPGYPLPGQPTEKGWGNISFSEVMYATNDNGGLSQWIELYNNTAESVDLTDWKVMIEARDSKTVRRWTSLRLKPLHIRPNATVLLVGRNARTSGNIPANRIYNLYRNNIAAFRRLGKGTNRFLGSEGFALRLFSPDGTLVDVAGNLDGRQTHDTPKWELPEGWTETGRRTSLIRGYDERLPRLGTLPGSFVRASDTSLLQGYSYWGLPTDDGTPGYRRGSPLPVTVSSVRADRAEGAVVVNWTTASEMENAGFYLLRSQNRKTGFVQVTPSLILGAGTTAERQNYTYRDTTVHPNIPYYYRIEEVSLSGQRRVVTTVRLRGHLSGVGKLLWKWADVKSQN